MFFAGLICIASLAGANPLIEVSEVAGLGDKALIVDARGAEAYAAGHIPGARLIDVAALSETRDGVRGLLKPVEQVTTILGNAGLSRDRHIVVYSGMKTPTEASSSTRLFWILELLGFEQVSVLDGGVEQWRAQGKPLATGAPEAVDAVKLDLIFKRELLATKEQVLELAQNSSCTLVDNRSGEEYAGAKSQDFVPRAGHIPTAESQPITQYFDEDNTFKEPSELEKVIHEAGIGTDKPIVTYCNTGRAASVGYFVQRLLGRPVALYDGSMAEWSLDESLPLEK